MNEVAFITEREPDWKRLSYLTDRADISPQNLTEQELAEFVQIYRRASRDLALVRTKSSNLQLIDFLNDLVAKAYSTLYRSQRRPFFAALGEAIVLSAVTVRKLRAFVLASVIVFAAGITFAAVGSAYSPGLRSVFTPEEFKSSFEQWKSGNFEERSAQESLTATSFYSSNNPRVAIIEGAIAAGTFGIGSAAMVWQNGAILGALAYQTSQVGKLQHLLIWLAPHGVTELSGLILSGAAGFRMGWALIAPGRRKRGDSLRAAGTDAVIVLCTAVCLMFMAAPVEGFFSFNPRIPDWIKISFAALAATAWAVFWIGYGKKVEEPSR
jgi:uncharacterized membrane protein SpoIIM required for sporulation